MGWLTISTLPIAARVALTLPAHPVVCRTIFRIIRLHAAGSSEMIGRILKPVSYTHLDVYKRQHRVRADTSQYVTDKFSDLYILFSELCEINLFYPS